MNGFASAFGEIIGSLIVGSFVVSYGIKTTMIGGFVGMFLSTLLYLFPIV